jgi:hypothetical protein
MHYSSLTSAAVRGFLLVLVFSQLRQHGAAAEPPRMQRWEVNATVILKDDSLNIFPEVHLGDPVYGTLMFDAARDSSYFEFAPDEGFSFGYEHPRWIEAVSMTIQNPRTDGETRFVKDVDGDWADMLVGNSTVEDWIIGAQSVISPSPSFTGDTPWSWLGFFDRP